MKPLLLLLAALALVGDLQPASGQTLDKEDRVVPESWETISNQWGSLPLEKIRQAANQGNLTAQYYLAMACLDGNGVAKDPDEAFKWLKPLADRGMIRAQQKLGWMYETGSGVAEDDAEAAKFYRLAAGQGDAVAQNSTGWCYLKGIGVPPDAGEALKWYQKSAEQGNVRAEKNLAWMYAQGSYGAGTVSGQGAEAQIRSGGNAPNQELAEKWMRQAVDLTSAEGQYQFGNLIFSEVNNEGHQDSTRFPVAALWFGKAAEQGYAGAQYQLAEMYNDGQLGNDQRSNCIPWYLKAAAQGNADAQAEVGELPALYPNNELLKPVKSIEILRQGGEQGNLDAQFQLAKRYQAGIGVPEDAVEAFKWMQQAAQNNASSSRVGDALYELGLMYEKGEGVTQDLSEAHNLYLQAASPDFFQADATARVGRMYENGEGVPQNDRRAAEFYSREICTTNSPGTYPNGLIEYLTPGDGALEALFKLWSQGRGFPGADKMNKPGYRAPGDLIRFWEGAIRTAKAEFYLGQVYYQGRLVSKDLVEADAHLKIAASQNLEGAHEQLDQVELEMSDAQKQAAKDRFDALERQFEQANMVVDSQRQVKAIMPW